MFYYKAHFCAMLMQLAFINMVFKCKHEFACLYGVYEMNVI